MPAFHQSIYMIQIEKRDHGAALDAIQSIAPDDSQVWKSPASSWIEIPIFWTKLVL